LLLLLIDSILLEHVLLNIVRDADRIDLLRDPVVHIRDEVRVPLLLRVEVIHVDTVGGEVRIELRLLGELALTDFFAPERMLSKMFPIDTFDWVFFKASC